MEPFSVILNLSGPNYRREVAVDGGVTEVELAAGPVDLVAAGPLEDDVLYTVENTGTFRAELWPSAAAPDVTQHDGDKLLPRGIMSIRTIQPEDGGPIWVWPSESGRTVVKVVKAPQ